MEEPITLADYDPAWGQRFQVEREALETVLRPWLAGPIEHIGSTAIPGMIAKPIIDIMACVADLVSSMPARAAVRDLEYQYYPYRSDVMHWFCKPSPSRRTHHLHLVPINAPLWAERLAFRDYLRANGTAASAYAELKLDLAKRYRFDREAYTHAKSDFVAEVLALARSAGPPSSTRGR